MIPRLTTTYLALTKSGTVVFSADRPSSVHAFIAKQAEKGVNLIPAVKRESITPLSERPALKLRVVGER